MAKCKNIDPQQEFANSIWLSSYCHTVIYHRQYFVLSESEHSCTLYNVQGLVYTSFPFMGIINYIWPLDQPSRTAVPSVSKTNVHHWISLSWRMLLVAQVSLTALLNQLLSWDMWLCPISIFFDTGLQWWKKKFTLFLFAKMFAVLSEREEKNQEKSTY